MSFRIALYIVVSIVSASFLLAWSSVAQETCLYSGLNFTGQQDIELRDIQQSASTITDYFERHYLVVDMSQHTCVHCVDFALEHNDDPAFQARVSWSWSCRFLTIVPNGTLSQWLWQVWWLQSFIGARSRSVIQDFYSIPTLYGGNQVVGVPFFFILNRDAEIVDSKPWWLPDSFYNLCIPESCYGSWYLLDEEEDEGNDDEETDDEEETCEWDWCGWDDPWWDDPWGDDGTCPGWNCDPPGDDPWWDDPGDDPWWDDPWGDDPGWEDPWWDDPGWTSDDPASESEIDPLDGNTDIDLYDTEYTQEAEWIAWEDGQIWKLRIEIPRENQPDIVSDTDILTARDAEKSFITTIKRSMNGFG